mmetsp:Transcript_30787/g.73918  ORF Transcript_30787/g.73918 Transcript_30787/m.73918 type:complete len:202 (+) Transcript_30787:753-1358(+)
MQGLSIVLQKEGDFRNLLSDTTAVGNIHASGKIWIVPGFCLFQRRLNCCCCCRWMMMLLKCRGQFGNGLQNHLGSLDTATTLSNHEILFGGTGITAGCRDASCRTGCCRTWCVVVVGSIIIVLIVVIIIIIIIIVHLRPCHETLDGSCIGGSPWRVGPSTWGLHHGWFFLLIFIIFFRWFLWTFSSCFRLFLRWFFMVFNS